MLVLTRRPGESVIIAGDIKITVVNVGPGRVKLGIEAPAHVRVDRQEIHEKIEQASDVLATVGSADVSGASHHTIINSGPDTATIVTGQSSAVPAGAAEPAAPAMAVNKLSKYRLPRKPR